MKKLIKTLAVLAAAAALSFGAASCSSDSSDSTPLPMPTPTPTPTPDNTQSVTALAVFTCKLDDETRTLTFSSDSSFKAVSSDGTTHAAGTYKLDSGNWENGKVTLTATSGTKKDTFTGSETITAKKITFSSKTYTLEGGTLQTPSDNSKTDTTTTTASSAVFTGEASVMGISKNAEISFSADGTHIVKLNGQNDEKGTYTLTGDFTNGTITMTQTHTWKNGAWKEEAGKPYTMKIVNGVGTNMYGSFTKKSEGTSTTTPTTTETSTTTPTTTATVSATFKGKVLGFDAEQIFYSDNTYLTKIAGADKYKGNYKLTGTWDSGSVTLSQTHEFKGGKWVEAKETSAVQIVNGKADLGNGDSLTKVAATDSSTSTGNSDSSNNENKEKPETKVTNDAAAFAGEPKGYPNGYKLLFKFNNDTYVIYMNGKEDEKGTYTLTGNFKNGTIKLTKTHKYEYGYDGNGEWKEEKGTTDCKITDGTLERWSSKYETVSYDYDVTQDLPPINVSINSNLYGTYVESQSVKYGEKVTKPEAPLADGFIFDNWYSDKELTTLFDFDKPISTEEYRECRAGKWYLHIYGKWTVDSDFKDNWTLEITNNGTKETVTNDYKAAIKALAKASAGSTIKISGLLIDAYTSNIDNYYGELRSEVNRNREYNLDLSELSIREKKTPYTSSGYMYDYYYGEGCWNVGYYGNGKIWKDSSSRIKTLKTPKSGNFEVESLPECTEITLTKGTKKFYMAKRASENLKSFSFEDEEGWVQVGRSDWDEYTQRPVSKLYQGFRDITSFMASWVKNHDNIKFENTRS